MTLNHWLLRPVSFFISSAAHTLSTCPSHVKFYLILELVAALRSVAVILVERAHSGTMGDRIRPYEVVFICNDI